MDGLQKKAEYGAKKGKEDTAVILRSMSDKGVIKKADADKIIAELMK